MEKINAYAKINLTLSVTGKRADGYHDLESVMHSIDIYDEVFLEASDTVSVECDVDIPKNNTAYRAANEYLKRCGGGARIIIKKGIPSEAGMGGASADAAAVLHLLQRMYNAYSEEELYALGKKIGADVPFCMMGGCALARGIGEILTPLSGIPLNLLVVKGSVGVSTSQLFSRLRLPLENADTDAMLDAVSKGDAAAVAANAYNALEKEAASGVKEISDYKQRLLDCGALSALMTGSGSAVYGIFKTALDAENAAKNFSDAAFVRACGTVLGYNI